MEGYAVLRAAALAGVPAIEVRVLANAIGEPDRRQWRFDEAKALLAERLPRPRRGARACLSCRRRCRPPSAPSASSSPRRSAPTAATSGACCRSACRSPCRPALARPRRRTCRCSCCWRSAAAVRAARTSAPAGSSTDARPTRDAFVRGAARLLPVAVPRARCSSCRRSRGSRSSASRRAAAIVERLGFRDALDPRPQARHRRLRARARLARRAGDRRRRRGADADLAAPLAGRQRPAHRALRSPTSSSRPLLYLGGALLYADQAARVGSRRPHRRRRRNADLHPPVDADPAGRPDPQVES